MFARYEVVLVLHAGDGEVFPRLLDVRDTHLAQSGVTDQTLEIYSGNELLLTTPLQSAHLGDTLRFNCPITAGEHSLRVVLYRADKTVFMRKENNSELHADGTNTMEVKVNRKSKMLLKHETSLEVVWPSSTASSSLVSSPGFKPAGALALR